MQDDKIRRIADEALERLTKALDAGHSDALKEYLAAQARFHNYSWNNVMLIAAQRPQATRVAGYHTWHDLGRFVRKGEKGIMIYAPVVAKAREPDPGSERSKEAARLSGFRTAYVFDVEQTDGKPLPVFAKTAGDPREYLDKLKAFAAERGIALSYDAAIAPAHGVSSGGQIRLLPGQSAAEEFSVLTHELAHEMLHHGKDQPRLSKTIRETQAEAVAFVVCRGIGLETNTAASDYIALYNGDKNTLAQSLSEIHGTSARILSELLPEERRGVPSTASISHREPSESSSSRDPAPSSVHAPPNADDGRNAPDRFDSPSLDR